MPAPHLEISWTTRFNAFLPCDNCTDVNERFNYLSKDGGFPDDSFVFETDNEGKWFWPEIAHLVDTVNIMGYDVGNWKGKPFKLDFAQILDNFAKYGMIPPGKINLGFEPGPQAAGGKWEGQAVDEAITKQIASKRIAGGAALWAVNPTPDKWNASVYCPETAEALRRILQPSFAYGTAANYTKCTMGGWWPSSPINGTCGVASEGGSVLLSCQGGGVISRVNFARYGTPSGSCAAGLQPSDACDVDISAEVEARCLGQEFCTVACAGQACMGTAVGDPCAGTKKKVAAAIECTIGVAEAFTV